MANLVISRKLKEARKAAGLTQTDVCAKIKVPQSTFSSWEIGKSEPDSDTFIKLCFIYGIESFSYFSESTEGLDNDLLDTIIPTNSEKELLNEFRQLGSENQSYIRVRTKELLKEEEQAAAKIKGA